MAKAYGVDYRHNFLSTYEQGYGTLEELAADFRVSLGWAKKVSAAYTRTGSMAPTAFHPGRRPKIETRRTDLASAMAGRATRLDAGRVTSQDQPTGTGTNPYFLPLSLAQAHGYATQKKSLHAARPRRARNLIRRQEFLAVVAKVIRSSCFSGRNWPDDLDDAPLRAGSGGCAHSGATPESQ